MRRTTALVITLLVAWTPAAAGPESRGQNFPLSLPTPEVSLKVPLGETGGQDTRTLAWGIASGELVVFEFENRTLWAHTSASQGTWFDPPVRVAGKPLEAGIEDFAFVGTPSGDLYVAYLAADPGGDVGLYLRRSENMGRTWTAPKPLVVRGDFRHGIVVARPATSSTIQVTGLQVDADDLGHVAVVFDEAWEQRDVWAMSSANGGDSWTGPVRLDQTDFAGAWDARLGDVHVAPGGVVHVAFLQDRGFGDRVWYTRSVDGGASYSLERKFDTLAPNLSSSATPDLVSARDGSVLLTFWDRTTSAATSSLFFLRSTDSGANFGPPLEGPFSQLFPIPFRLLPSRYTGALDNDQVLLAIDLGGELQLYGSNDNGAEYGWLEFFPQVAVSGSGAFDLASTPEGEWVVAWEKLQVGEVYDWGVYAVGSALGGFFWTEPTRADQGPGAAAESRLGNVAVTGMNTVFMAYRDLRNDGQRHYDVYVADSPLLSEDPGLSFAGHERRLDTDQEGGNLRLGENAAVVVDGPTRVFVAAVAASPGPETHILFTRSEDGGRSFIPPAVKVSTHDASITRADRVTMAARPAGFVCLLWERQTPTSFELVFSRSLDYGTTWLPEIVLATSSRSFQHHTLAVTPSAVVAAWSDWNDVYYRRSTNGGSSFGPALNLDQNTAGYSVTPRFCVQGERIVAAYEGDNGPTLDVSPWARLSADGGATWSARAELRPPAATGQSWGLNLECDAGTTAVATWSDPRTGATRAYASRLSGTVWSPDLPLGGPPGIQWLPAVAFAGNDTWVIAFHDFATQVSATRSTDGGASWATPVRLDDVAPQPLASRGNPAVASDGAGNVWIGWDDGSAGKSSVVARHSPDGGATYGALRRANTDLPQGGNGSFGASLRALPSAGLVVWGGYRSSTDYHEILVNRWDAVDIDGDGFPDAADCSDSPSTYPGAPEINDGQDNNCPGDPGAGLVDELGTWVVGPNDDKLCWGGQAGATQYLVARSTSPGMSASCSTATTAGNCYTDTTVPAAGQTFYYLVRANAPHVGSWGADGDGQERAVSCAP